jgi:hypothetical protein
MRLRLESSIYHSIAQSTTQTPKQYVVAMAPSQTGQRGIINLRVGKREPQGVAKLPGIDAEVWRLYVPFVNRQTLTGIAAAQTLPPLPHRREPPRLDPHAITPAGPNAERIYEQGTLLCKLYGLGKYLLDEAFCVTVVDDLLHVGTTSCKRT